MWNEKTAQAIDFFYDVVAALDRLPTAVLIVTESLEVVCLNGQAETLLANCKTLYVRAGELVLESPREASALRKAVGETLALAADGDTAVPPQVVGISRGAKLDLDALAVPLRPRYQVGQPDGEDPRVMLMIYDPESRPRIDAVVIERLFDLTVTEALVAAMLAEGNSIAEIAEERSCAASTVRSHVKSVFKKTRTNRQGELVQLILTSPAISFGR